MTQTTFTKRDFNKDFNYDDKIKSIFADLGFNDLRIKTSTTNGLSHYVGVKDFVLLDENKLYADMFVFQGITHITVRISDHSSNLDTICGGVDGNKMNLNAFKHLISTGAIAPKKA